MNSGSRKRIRILGKILFVLYIIFIIYFLLFSDWYGRTGQMQEYHYNLVLFKEIKRFWSYRDQVGMVATFTNLFGNVVIFMDDLLLNTLGGVAGYLIFIICVALRRIHGRKK